MIKQIYSEQNLMKPIISGVLAVLGAYVLLWIFSVGALFAYPTLAKSTVNDQLDRAFSNDYRTYQEYYKSGGPSDERAKVAYGDWVALLNARAKATDKAAFDNEKFGEYDLRAIKFIERNLNVSLDLSSIPEKFERVKLLAGLVRTENPIKAKTKLKVRVLGEETAEVELGKYDRAFKLQADQSSLANVNLKINDQIESKVTKEADGRTYFSCSFENFIIKKFIIKKGDHEITPKFRLTGSASLSEYQNFLSDYRSSESKSSNDFSSFQSSQNGDKIDITIRYRDVPVKVSHGERVVVVTSDDQHIHGKSIDTLKPIEIRNAKLRVVRGVTELKELIKKSNQQDLSAIDLFAPKNACPI